MDLVARIAQQFTDSAQTKLAALEFMADPIAAAIDAMTHSLMSNGKILACGNGGSAADAQHFAAELLNRFELERPPWPPRPHHRQLHAHLDRQRLRLLRSSPSRCAPSASPATCCWPSPPAATRPT
jgi:hypothetical protein